MSTRPWHLLKEEELLEKRISEFELSIEGHPVERLIAKLYAELSAKGLVFQPPCFPAEEWFCPVGIPAIGVPFYLLHRRLKKLEEKYILEVEGGSRAEFMRLIRHEAGHAYSYAYHLHRKKKWRTLFGSPNEEYPETYRPRPYSRSFVIHLDNWYAQSHPDEDFAETFAVWLTPKSGWRKKYKNWKALEKLKYMDELMSSIRNKQPLHQPKFKQQEYDGLRQKLKTYFNNKKKLSEEAYPDFYDKDLRELFTDLPEESSDLKAWQYLKSKRSLILRSVTQWTKERKYTVDQLIQNFISRTRELKLYVKNNHDELDVQISSYITSLVTNYLFTGRFKRSK